MSEKCGSVAGTATFSPPRRSISRRKSAAQERDRDSPALDSHARCRNRRAGNVQLQETDGNTEAKQFRSERQLARTFWLL